MFGSDSYFHRFDCRLFQLNQIDIVIEMIKGINTFEKIKIYND